MCGYGIQEEAIGKVLGIDPKTLRKHYRLELDLGQVEANTKVVANLFRIATGDGPKAVTAAIFWLKCRLRWTEARDADEPPLGKKEAARIAAKAPDESTSIGELMAVRQEVPADAREAIN
jgi:hypothetical protein